MADTSKLNKADLCAELGWSRPRLDRVLERDSNFPVRTRGDSADGWTFNLAMVTRYLAAGGGKLKTGRPPKTKAEELAVAKQPDPPKAPAQHQGEATAKQRRDEVSAELMMDKLRRDRGELLDREDVRQTVAGAFAVFSRNLDTLPDQVVKVLGLDEDKTERVRELVGEVRKKLVDDLTPLLA